MYAYIDISNIAQSTTKVYNIPIDSDFYSEQKNVTVRIEPIYTQYDHSQNDTNAINQTESQNQQTTQSSQIKESSSSADDDTNKESTSTTADETKKKNEVKE